MRQVNVSRDDERDVFYLTHHCVFKNPFRESKIRVIFDASYKSNSCVSLNDALMVGPVIQQDLISILMRFRTFIYVFVADIIKMYRQILLDSSQTRYQRMAGRSRFRDQNIRVLNRDV